MKITDEQAIEVLIGNMQTIRGMLPNSSELADELDRSIESLTEFRPGPGSHPPNLRLVSSDSEGAA